MNLELKDDERKILIRALRRFVDDAEAYLIRDNSCTREEYKDAIILRNKLAKGE